MSARSAWLRKPPPFPGPRTSPGSGRGRGRLRKVPIPQPVEDSLPELGHACGIPNGVLQPSAANRLGTGFTCGSIPCWLGQTRPWSGLLKPFLLTSLGTESPAASITGITGLARVITSATRLPGNHWLEARERDAIPRSQ